MRWDYFGQRSSRFPAFNQAWNTSISCLGKRRFQSWTAQNEKLQEPTFRLFQPMKKEQGVQYMKRYVRIWNDHLRRPHFKKNAAQISLKSSHLREWYLLEMPILNDHAAETLDFLIFLVVHSSELSVSPPAWRKRFWSAFEVNGQKKNLTFDPWCEIENCILHMFLSYNYNNIRKYLYNVHLLCFYTTVIKLYMYTLLEAVLNYIGNTVPAGSS